MIRGNILRSYGTHTQFWMDVYGTMLLGFAYLEDAMQSLDPNHLTYQLSLKSTEFCKRYIVTKQVIVPDSIQSQLGNGLLMMPDTVAIGFYCKVR